MQFNVASLLKEPTGAVREYDIDDDFVVDAQRRHVTGYARLDRTPAGVLVRAKMKGIMQAECSRCLKPVAPEVSIEVEEEYLPTVDLHTGAPVIPAEGQEDAYRIDARHVLDLSLAAQQYWSLAAPMAPVCSEGCSGLCAACGADLNAAAHTCSGEQIDARWEKLAQLRGP